MAEHEVRFRVTESHMWGKYTISVYPSLHNIYLADGGEEILLAIAANCVRMVAKRNGLEGAMQRFHHAAVTRTKNIKDDWPWNV